MTALYTLHKNTLERATHYAKAHSLDLGALISAAITMTVPEELGGTATPDVLELERRAKVLAKEEES